MILVPVCLAACLAALRSFVGYVEGMHRALQQAIAIVRYAALNHDGRRRVMRIVKREARRLTAEAWDRAQEVFDRIRAAQVGPEYARWRKSYWEAKRFVRAKRRQMAFADGIYAMSTGVHTDIAVGAAANAAILNAPLDQLDQALLNKRYDLKAQGGALMNGIATETSIGQAGIDAMAAQNGGIVWAPAGVLLTDTLTLKSGVWICAASPGATQFKQASDAANHHTIVTALGAVNCGVLNLGFVGVGTTGGNTYGVVIGQNGPVARARVEGCTFTAFSGGGADIGGVITGVNTDITIRSCSFFDNAVNTGQPPGIALTNGQRIKIMGCDIQQSSADRTFAGANYGIDMEPNQDTDIIQDVVISGCTIRNTGAGGIQVLTRATSLNQTKNVAIDSC